MLGLHYYLLQVELESKGDDKKKKEKKKKRRSVPKKKVTEQQLTPDDLKRYSDESISMDPTHA